MIGSLLVSDDQEKIGVLTHGHYHPLMSNYHTINWLEMSSITSS
jgi:hypothetical protein